RSLGHAERGAGRQARRQRPTPMMRAALTILLTFFLGAVGGLATGAVALIVVAWAGLTGLGYGPRGLALLAAASPFGLLLALAAREWGPLLAARLARFRAQLVIIGPFGFARQGATFRPFRHRSLFDQPGMVVACPADDRRLRARYAAFIGGGPL